MDPLVRVSHAPIRVVISADLVAWALALIARTSRLGDFTGRFSATIVICDEICLLIRRIVAGADPRDGRRLRPGRALRRATAARIASVSIERTVRPIVTA